MKHNNKSYAFVTIGNKRVQEHRVIMEKHLGRKLHTKEIIHHIDHDKRNNSIDNLKIMKQGDHARLHVVPRTFSFESAIVLFNNGLNMNQIANELNVPYINVYRSFIRRGVVKKRNPKRLPFTFPFKKALYLYSKGLNIRQIAEKLNAEYKHIRRCFVRRGII